MAAHLMRETQHHWRWCFVCAMLFEWTQTHSPTRHLANITSGRTTTARTKTVKQLVPPLASSGRYDTLGISSVKKRSSHQCDWRTTKGRLHAFRSTFLPRKVCLQLRRDRVRVCTCVRGFVCGLVANVSFCRRFCACFGVSA